TVIRKIEAFFDQGVDINNPMLTRAFARVQQHGSRLRRHQLRAFASRRLPTVRQTWTAAYAHILEEFTLGSSNRLVTPERVPRALEPEPCLETRPAEVVAQHAKAVPRDVG